METDQESTESPYIKRITMWSDVETKLLFDKYVSYLPNIGPTKDFKNKKEMWEKISTEIEGRTPKQCEERYKTVLKRRKSGGKNDYSSAVKRQRIDLKQDLEGIAESDPFFEPEIRMSSRATSASNATAPSPQAQDTEVEAETEGKRSIQETLLLIAKRREEGRERRHREKMQALNNIQRILKLFLVNEIKD